MTGIHRSNPTATVIDTRPGEVRVRLDDNTDLPRWYPSVTRRALVGSVGTMLRKNQEDMLFIPHGRHTDPLNVKSFGAKGDGVTDDYAAIQAALDAAEGGRLYFPTGVYLRATNTPWLFPDNTLIEGEASTLFSLPVWGLNRGAVLMNAPGMTTDIARGKALSTSGPWSHGLVVRNITFMAHTNQANPWVVAGQASGSGFRYCPGEISEVDNCAFVGFPDGGLVLEGYVAPGKIGNISCFHNKYGVWLDGTNPVSGGAGGHFGIAGPVAIDLLSGDNNKHLLYIEQPTNNPNEGGYSFTVQIKSIKAETGAGWIWSGQAHNPVIAMYNANAAVLSVGGGWVTNYGRNTGVTNNFITIMQNGTADARSGNVSVRDLTLLDYDNVINDETTGETYPWVAPGGDWEVWRKVGEISHGPAHRIRSSADAYDKAFELRGTMPLLRMYDTDAGKHADILSGTGSPEGAFFAGIGSIYLRTDGGAGTTLYVKQSNPTGNTGWVGK